ncbi:MAG: hypothetical protein ABH859_06220 [Pseudomonadota bacterium]
MFLNLVALVVSGCSSSRPIDDGLEAEQCLNAQDLESPQATELVSTYVSADNRYRVLISNSIEQQLRDPFGEFLLEVVRNQASSIGNILWQDVGDIREPLRNQVHASPWTPAADNPLTFQVLIQQLAEFRNQPMLATHILTAQDRIDIQEFVADYDWMEMDLWDRRWHITQEIYLALNHQVGSPEIAGPRYISAGLAEYVRIQAQRESFEGELNPQASEILYGPNILEIVEREGEIIDLPERERGIVDTVWLIYKDLGMATFGYEQNYPYACDEAGNRTCEINIDIGWSARVQDIIISTSGMQSGYGVETIIYQAVGDHYLGILCAEEGFQRLDHYRIPRGNQFGEIDVLGPMEEFGPENVAATGVCFLEALSRETGVLPRGISNSLLQFAKANQCPAVSVDLVQLLAADIRRDETVIRQVFEQFNVETGTDTYLLGGVFFN